MSIICMANIRSKGYQHDSERSAYSVSNTSTTLAFIGSDEFVLGQDPCQG
jgi:hypothetical protein